MKKRNGLLVTLFLLSLILMYSNNNVKSQCKSERQQIYDKSGITLLQEPHKDVQIQEKTDNQKMGSGGKKIQIKIPKKTHITPKIYSSSSLMAYEVHDPFYIDDNADFGPLGYNFTGDGTFSKPYLVEGYQITNASYNLIHIENTTAYFTIASNLLNGVSNNKDGIYLKNVTHGIIYNNSVSNCVGAVNLESSYNNTVNENMLSFSNNGISLDYSNNNKIFVNTVYNSTLSGIYGQNSHNTSCFNNTAYYNTWAGIWFTESNKSKITQNSVYNNGWDGIGIQVSYNNNISINDAYSNTLSGIKLINSSENQVGKNYIYQNLENGIYLDSSDANTVEDNYAYQNSEHGVFVRYSVNNTIINNQLYSNAKNGNTLINSHYNVVDSNDIYCNGNTTACSPSGISDISFSIQQFGGGNGIFLDPSNYNKITDNYIFNNSENGIRLESSSHNLIDGNDIYGNGDNSGGSPHGISDISFSIQQFGGGNGIFLDPSNYNNITYNTIFNNSGDGITIVNSSNNLIQGNDIYGNGGGGGDGSPQGIFDISFSIQQLGGGNGIFLDPADSNTISRNTIHDNNHHGLILIDSDGTEVFDNILYHNRLYGIYIDSGVSNRVYWNDLIANNLEGTSQAFNEGEESLFEYNYWDEWTFPDEDEDGIVDESYKIDTAEEGNYDFDHSPFTFPHNSRTMEMHLISRPRVLYPNGGETISDTIRVEWAKTTDFWGHEISYSVYYSKNNGETWELIKSEISELFLRWDTTSDADGVNYLIKVVATCSEDLQVEDISDSLFTVHNGKQPITTETEPTALSSSTTPTRTSAPSLLLFLVTIYCVIKFKSRNRK